MKSLLNLLWKFIKISMLIPVILLAGLFILGVVLALKHSIEYHFGFSKQLWLASSERPASNVREGMVQDVMAHYLRPGMSRQEVRQLLGPAELDTVVMRVPDNISLPDSLTSEKGRNNDRGFNEWFRLNSQPDTLMRYPVGWDLIDPTSLHITINGSGKVVKYWVSIH